MAAVILAGFSPMPARACPGDCNGDGRVSIAELVVAVDAALGQAVANCKAIDTDGNGTVAIGELIGAVNAALGGCPGTPPQGTLQISIVDVATRSLTPARLELLDSAGNWHVLPTSLQTVGECQRHSAPDWWADGTSNPGRPLGIDFHASGTVQFYADGAVEATLPTGTYHLAVHKGLEYTSESTSFEIRRGRTTVVEVGMSRWIDMGARGWFGADAHLHIRRTPEADPVIASWMRAEDLNVATLLQVGNSTGPIAANQSGFGTGGVYREGNTIIASGQENPRTWLLGHAIAIGAPFYLDRQQGYLTYDDVFEEAHQYGAAVGYAHWQPVGLALDAPLGLIDLLEVLQFDVAAYGAWYDTLNYGARIVPIAGTDYPCFPAGPPGSQRFYTKVDGSLSFAAWLDGLRAGRTFVTNGPMLEMSIDGIEVGGELELMGPGLVTIDGTVRFDPTRDDVQLLELVRNGDVVSAEAQRSGPGRIKIQVVQRVDETTWFALRSSGEKIDVAEPVGGRNRQSAAHTAATFVSVRGTPPLDRQPHGRAVASRALARLDTLTEQFSDRAIDSLNPTLERILGVSAEVMRRDRHLVLERIERARRDFEAAAASSETPPATLNPPPRR